MVAPNYRAAPDFAAIGADGASAGQALASQADPKQFRVRDGTVSIAELRTLQPLIENASETLAYAEQRLAGIHRRFLIAPVRNAIDRFAKRLHSAVHDSRVAADAARLLPAILGADGTKRHFVAFQNNAETRATGGFIGSWAILGAENGHLDLGVVQRSATLLPPTSPGP